METYGPSKERIRMEKEKEEKQKCQAKITDTTAKHTPRSRRRERCEAQKDTYQAGQLG